MAYFPFGEPKENNNEPKENPTELVPNLVDNSILPGNPAFHRSYFDYQEIHD